MSKVKIKLVKAKVTNLRRIIVMMMMMMIIRRRRRRRGVGMLIVKKMNLINLIAPNHSLRRGSKTV